MHAPRGLQHGGWAMERHAGVALHAASRSVLIGIAQLIPTCVYLRLSCGASAQRTSTPLLDLYNTDATSPSLPKNLACAILPPSLLRKPSNTANRKKSVQAALLTMPTRVAEGQQQQRLFRKRVHFDAGRPARTAKEFLIWPVSGMTKAFTRLHSAQQLREPEAGQLQTVVGGCAGASVRLRLS